MATGTQNQSLSSLGQPRSLLVRGVNWLGDAVMTTPALQRLRERFPETQITLLTHQKLAELWRQHPSIDEVMTFAPGESVWSISKRLREKRFEAALVLPNSPRSALEVWLGRVPHRIGYAQPWRNWLLTQQVALRPERVRMHKRTEREVKHLIDSREHSQERASASNSTREQPKSHSHQIYEYLHLVAALGANPGPVSPKLEIAPTEIQSTEAGLLSSIHNGAEKSATQQPSFWLGLNPAAAYGPAKCWPSQNFAAVMREVSRQHESGVWLLFGDGKDAKLCDDIARQAGCRAINLAGKTSLRELMALLKLCRVLLTNDSGPMHVAAALGTPVVVPFGSTSSTLTGPGLPDDSRHYVFQSTVACSPCFRRTCPIDFRCMTSITVEKASAAVLNILANERPDSLLHPDFV